MTQMIPELGDFDRPSHDILSADRPAGDDTSTNPQQPDLPGDYWESMCCT